MKRILLSAVVLALIVPVMFLVTACDTETVPPQPAVPGAPHTLNAVAGDGQVTMGWSAPANDGGSAITGFQVRVGDGDWVAAVNPHVVTGLASGTQYTFYVRAVNAVGAGAYATTQATTLGTQVPPTDELPVTVANLQGTWRMTMTFPSWDNGGTGDGGYLVQATIPTTESITIAYYFTFTGNNIAMRVVFPNDPEENFATTWTLAGNVLTIVEIADELEIAPWTIVSLTASTLVVASDDFDENMTFNRV